MTITTTNMTTTTISTDKAVEIIKERTGHTYSPRSFTRACREGRVPGAYRFGVRWLVPATGLDKFIGDGA